MRRKDFVREASKTFPGERKRMQILSGEAVYGEFEFIHDFASLDRSAQQKGSAIVSAFPRQRSEKENLARHSELKNLFGEQCLTFHELYGMYQVLSDDEEGHAFHPDLPHDDLLLCHVPCDLRVCPDYENFSAWMQEIVSRKLETAALLLVNPDGRSAKYRDHETSINFDMARCDVQASLELFIKSRMQGPEETAIVSRWAIRKPASANDALLMQKKGIL